MTIQQICQLLEEVRTGELLEAVFIDQVIKDPDSKEADASFVLCATYPTIPLRGLVELMAQKLSGEHPKGTVVIRGDYGSGKSHVLLALYHVASLGSEAQGWLNEWNIHGRFPEHINVALVQLVSENPDTFWELLRESWYWLKCADTHHGELHLRGVRNLGGLWNIGERPREESSNGKGIGSTVSEGIRGTGRTHDRQTP